KENPPSSARSDGCAATTGTSKVNNEAAPAPVDKFKHLSLGTPHRKRSFMRGRHDDSPTHLSAPPIARKPSTETERSLYGSMRRPHHDEKLKVEPIDVDELKKDKVFAKLLKRFQKDSEELKKKHQKQRDSIQKQQVGDHVIELMFSLLFWVVVLPVPMNIS
ncbi:hypothetical protein OSTOST_11387, partial [Ostertagia ostertagi]